MQDLQFSDDEIVAGLERLQRDWERDHHRDDDDDEEEEEGIVVQNEEDDGRGTGLGILFGHEQQQQQHDERQEQAQEEEEDDDETRPQVQERVEGEGEGDDGHVPGRDIRWEPRRRRQQQPPQVHLQAEEDDGHDEVERLWEQRRRRQEQQQQQAQIQQEEDDEDGDTDGSVYAPERLREEQQQQHHHHHHHQQQQEARPQAQGQEDGHGEQVPGRDIRWAQQRQPPHVLQEEYDDDDDDDDDDDEDVHDPERHWEEEPQFDQDLDQDLDSQSDMSEPPLPRHIAEHIKYWHPVYTSIVHRSEAVTLRRPPLYPPGYAIPTHLSNPAPFPFNLDPTTNCSLLLLFVLLLHSSLQTGHLFQQTPLLFHILSRVTITFLASILSTFLFEILGELLTQRLQTLSQKIRDIVSEFLVRRFEWGDLDQDNNPVREDDEGGDIVLRADPAFLHEPVREAVSGGIILTIHYLTTLLLRLFNDLISIHLSHPLLTLSLPLPPESSTTSQTTTTTSLLENLLPLLIQSTILLPLLWLTFSLFLARAERFALPGQYGHAIDDPKSSLFAHLVRATTMHLIAYTAYQAVVLVTPSIYPRIPSFLKMNSPFLSKLFPKASPLPAVLIFFLHYFLRHLSSFIAKNARGIFIPYLRWFTPLTEDGATSLWPALIHPLDEEMNVLDPGKRVISRVVMTALFGLESSWPARYHLSNLVPDD